jgi:hypothetical protein
MLTTLMMVETERLGGQYNCQVVGRLKISAYLRTGIENGAAFWEKTSVFTGNEPLNGKTKSHFGVRVALQWWSWPVLMFAHDSVEVKIPTSMRGRTLRKNEENHSSVSKSDAIDSHWTKSLDSFWFIRGGDRMQDFFQRVAAAAVDRGDRNLPGRQEWVELRSFCGIIYWPLLDCLDFMVLSPTTQEKLPGSISPAVSRLAVRMRIMDILGPIYIPPQFRGTAIGRRGRYAVLERWFLAWTCNLAQRTSLVPEPVVVKPGNGASMNGLIRDMHDKVRDQAVFLRQWERRHIYIPKKPELGHE